jgi:hypothetical protein
MEPEALAAVVAAVMAAMGQQAPSTGRKKTKAAAVEVDDKPVSGGRVDEPEAKRLTGRRYVITSAQNNTDVHQGFWASLQQYARAQRAEILVSRFSYNKTGWGQPHQVTKGSEELFYDPAVLPHICDERVRLADDLVLCGELDILPTAADPLSGLDNYGKGASIIVPHAKVALKSLPRLKGAPFRHNFTTGACTLRSYIDRKAGQKAAFHHVYGALVVEIDRDGDWFVRQIMASEEDGSFYDLTNYYTPDGVFASEVEAVNWGDIHAEKADDEVMAACWFDKNAIIDVLRPPPRFLRQRSDKGC